MKIALFRSSVFNYVAPWYRAPLTDGWTQVTGWAEVEFPPLSPEEQRVSDKLVALSRRQASFEEDFRRQRKALEDERAALLKIGT